MLKSIRKRSELTKLSDLLSFDGFHCDVVTPGRQFSAAGTFRVRVAYPGQKEPKKWKTWEAWLLSDLVLFGEREKIKGSDRLTLKLWIPFESCSFEAEVPPQLSGMLSPDSGGGALTKRLHKPKNERSHGEGELVLHCNGATLILQCDSKDQQVTWSKKLQKKLSAFRQLSGDGPDDPDAKEKEKK